MDWHWYMYDVFDIRPQDVYIHLSGHQELFWGAECAAENITFLRYE